MPTLSKNDPRLTKRIKIGAKRHQGKNALKSHEVDVGIVKPITCANNFLSQCNARSSRPEFKGSLGM